MRVVLAQINPTVGDLRGNLALIQQEITYAAQENAHVVIFPELATVGYPPRDLLYDERLWKSHEEVIGKLYKFLRSLGKPITAIVGGLHRAELSHGRFARYNAAFIMDAHKVRVVHKRLLPCYDVFDETRYFVPALQEPYAPLAIKAGDEVSSFDVLICEDIWNYEFQTAATWMSPASYEVDPVHNLRGSGPIVVINASPYWHGKLQITRDLLQNIATKTKRTVLWCNQVGGHDDIVFGGYSMVVSPEPIFRVKSQAYLGSIAMAAAFESDRLFVDIDISQSPECGAVRVMGGLDMQKEYNEWNPIIRVGPIKLDADLNEPSQAHVAPGDLDDYYLLAQLRLGLKDYCRRCGFKTIVFGASGGIDSAVVGAIATLTLGGENCTAMALPSPHSSPGSWKDAEALATNCKMHYMRQDITDVYDALKRTILVSGKLKFKRGVTDENLQPRARGILLMAESNDEGSLLLACGNKSELAVGYCTIYGDMCGGLGLLSDVPKTWVYRLAKFINKYYGGLIPENSISKPPSAELAPDQKDIDALPPYDILDPILDALDRQTDVERIKKFTPLPDKEVDRILHLLEMAEHKRSQAAIGIKVTERAYGSGRRVPVAKNVTYV